MIGRLIQDQAGRLLRQRPRQDHPLLLAAGQRGKIPVGKFVHSDGFQRLIHNLEIFRPVLLQHLFMRRPPHHHHFADGKFKIVIIMLGDDRHLSGRIPDLHFMQFLITQPDTSAVGLQYPVNTFEQRGFSAPVWTDDPHELSGVGLQGDSFQYPCRSVGQSRVLCAYFHYSAPPNP